MKYRKKPVVVEAYQTDKEMDIETLEGTMHASVGDYIITGVRGEKYPCKPDIFEQTYEPADAPAAAPWHRVEERLPKPNRNVLWWCEIRGMGHIRIGQYEGATNHGIPEVSCCGPACKPLYWMPLPEPPKEDA